MTERATWFVAGVVAGALVLGVIGRRQYASLRAFADSTKVAAAIDVANARHYGDSLKGVVGQLASRRTTLVVRAAADTARADSALRVARTATDSLAAYKVEVATLRTANRTLFEAQAVSDSIIAAQRLDVDSCGRTIETLNGRIATLVGRVDRLGGLPKWAKVSLTVGGLVAAGYGGYKVGQRH